MVRAHDLAGDARVLYGPLSQRPTPAEAGSGALWVDPSDQTLSHVQSGNWVAVSAAGGASAGTPVLYGPYTVDYTDIPHDGDLMTLWTPAVGDVLLRLFPDPQTVTQWDHGYLNVGQGLPVTALLAVAQAGHIGYGVAGPNGVLDNVTDALNDANFDATGNPFHSTAFVCHSTDPVQVGLFATGGTDPTQGHVELFALIARPVSP